MRYFKLFDGNLAFVQPATNLGFIGAFQPEFDRFLDHFFSMLRRFALTDDPKFGAICDIPTIITGLNHSGEFRKFHHQQAILPRRFWKE